MPRITYTEDDKGAPIRVVHGKYVGRIGWKHEGRRETEEQVYLILQAVVKNASAESSMRAGIVSERMQKLKISIGQEHQLKTAEDDKDLKSELKKGFISGLKNKLRRSKTCN